MSTATAAETLAPLPYAPRMADAIEPDAERLDALLMRGLEEACNRGRELAQTQRGLPQREVAGLERTRRGLSAVRRTETSWKLAALVIGGAAKARLPDLIEELRVDVPGRSPAEGDGRGFTDRFWDDALAPLLERYGARRPALEWDAGFARELVAHRRRLLSSDSVPRRTIAPLANLRANGTVRLGPDTVIRAMTDEDRDELWRQFGGVGHIPHLGPQQLAAWRYVIDHRWEMSRAQPVDEEIGTQRVWDIVTALRLQHSGVVGTTFQWNRPDPPDLPLSAPWGEETLFSALSGPMFDAGATIEIGADDGASLAGLAARVAAARKVRATALALRRFDGAYERRDPEDALLDLWIAFEALLIPGDTAELSYRASLRIGRLVGGSREERWQAFKDARQSYRMRSKVVHGEAPPKDLDQVLSKTRVLARKAIVAWLLNPPAGGADDLDRDMLA